jgi:hypothetical protein
MYDPSDSQPLTTPEPEASDSQVSAGRDLSAGRDIAGRDVVTQTTLVGLSPKFALQLAALVGMMVFVTAACFFSGGIALGAGAFVALNRQVDSNVLAAASMQGKLQQVSALPPNQRVRLGFTEEELSSYFRFVLAPELGIHDGRARFLSADRLLIYGQTSQLGNLPFIATYTVQLNSSDPLRLTGAAVQWIRVGESNIGWVAVPTFFFRTLDDQVRDLLGPNLWLTSVQVLPGEAPAWVVEGVTVTQ